MPGETKKCPSLDCYHRINYLNQISKVMIHDLGMPVLAAYYGSIIESLSKKCVIKLDSNVKRGMCKNCKIMLIPNETAVVRIKGKKGKKTVTWRCLLCNSVRRYRMSGNKSAGDDALESHTDSD